MIIRCCNFEELAKIIKSDSREVVMFGAGVIGTVITPQILKQFDIIENIDCYIDNDNSKWGTSIEILNENIPINSPQYLETCSENTVILLNISRYSDVLAQLGSMDFTSNMHCYIMPMMLIHNYCMDVSEGNVRSRQKALIPRKLHYMWLGRNPIPNSLRKCIESWRTFCPEYEIIEWNEDNYDIDKHPYMKQAYDAGAYGFVPDYARLDILYNEGGLYLDTDVEIKRNIDDLLFQEAFCGVEKWQVINFGGLSGAIKGHSMIRKFLEARKDIFFIDNYGKQNRNTCGYYDTRVAIKNGYQINGKTQTIEGMNIYAYDYFQPYDYMSGVLNETANTHSVHWFNGGWLDEKTKKANEESAKQFSALYESSCERS